jgi:CelD/BcsL family acetyltransferase involved in cellulose biosynthesis
MRTSGLLATVPSPRGVRPPTKLSLHAYESLDELSALRPAWDELLSHYPAGTTFSTWEWLSCWWRCFGKNRQLLTLALFDSGSLVGVAPLSISKERVGLFSLRVLRLMGDGSGDSDNLDMPVQPGFERVFAEAILQCLKHRRKGWDVCLFNTLPRCSLVAGCLAEILSSPSWTFFEYSSKSSAVLLPESWQLYAQTLSGEDRKNLIRYTRRLQVRYSTRIYRCAEPEELPICLEALFRLHQERWQSAGQPGSFSSVERREFYVQLSRHLLTRRWLELWVLELDGEIAAVQFAFRYGKNVFQLQEGYDHTRASDRPGYVLRGEVLKRLIAEKVRTYDFLGGEDPYKARWGACEGQYRQLHFAPSLGCGGAWLQCLNTAGRGKEWLRQKAPSSVWSLLHEAKGAVQRRPPARTRDDLKIPE